MTLDMDDDSLMSIAQLKELLKLSESAKFNSLSVDQSYEWIAKTLKKFRYGRLSKKDKGAVKKYLRSMTGYSETHIDRLIARKKKTGRIIKKKRTQPTFERFYTVDDIALLSEIDNAENRRNGKAVKKTCRDMYLVYNDSRFERLAKISVSHIYNLRKTRVYESRSLTYTKTNPTSVDIGVRTKPSPNGIPGFVRVDSVHQGDKGKEKGVYYINLVDEVTQWEIVVCVEAISEFYLLPALQKILEQYPCILVNFHSDNGSEYINYVVANLLEKMHSRQTKSRARHTNDNALVEGKNAAVIRKQLGFSHIPKKYAPLIEEWCENYFNPYINFHRQCSFATDIINGKGKVAKVYDIYLTPCEKLLSISEFEKYLKPEVTKESLVKLQMLKNHLDSAKEMQEGKKKVFNKIRQDMLL
jgi:hypothetical protein